MQQLLTQPHIHGEEHSYYGNLLCEKKFVLTRENVSKAIAGSVFRNQCHFMV